MIEIRKTREFAVWLDSLRDLRARARVQVRIGRLAEGNPGNVRAVGEGVSELKIDHGPGYRVYYTQKRGVLILLLCGGDKRTQEADISRAIKLARTLRTEP